MYSVVLMAALTTTTADVPSWGCRGCCGWRASCSGCYGCNGCYGGGCWGGARYGCRGCTGGCYGGGCYGGCHGGCYGGCTGRACHGGCNGYACQGCHGCTGCNGKSAAPPQAKPEPLMKPAEDKTKKQTSTGQGAKLIVDLPADAKLFIDDRPVNVTSQHPIFATPTLEEGKRYYYEVRAEVVRDGKTLSDTKRVEFRAGDEVRESFANLAPIATEKVAVSSK